MATNKEQPAAQPTPAEKVDAAVREWFDEHIRNSPIAQEQRAWAHALDATEALKRKLLERLF